MNTIQKAIRYLSEPEAIRKVLNNSLRTADLETPCIFVGAQTVRYQRIRFGGTKVGKFDREKGYSRKDITLDWVEKTLEQDNGDSLMIDRMDDEESMANGIVTIANRYMDRIQNPSVDTYRLSKIAASEGTFVINMTLTAENIYQQILAGKARMEDLKINTDALLLYITPQAKALLKEAALAKGYWSHGHWNGVLDAEVEMFDGCKVVPVPSSFFGNSNVQAILLHKDAAPAMIKYREAVYFDKIPGYGGRKAQVDIGIYHDSFVYDELTRSICIFVKTTTETKTVTYAKGEVTTTKTVPTQAATVVGGSFTVAANPFSDADKTFVGWSDGHNVYQPGDTYYIPMNNVTLEALWS